MMEENERRLRRRRLRQVGEPLTENSSLRDALTDEQATELLNWGLAQLDPVVAQTLALDDAAAEPLLAAQADLVRQLMHQVNRLVTLLPDPAAEMAEVWQQLLLFSQLLRRQRPTPAGAEQTTAALFQLVQDRTSLSQADIFRQLMQLLQPKETA